MSRLAGRIPLPRPRLPRRVAVGIALVAVLLVPTWLWARDSALARVEHVHVSGLLGPQAQQIRQAIVDAAEHQSTLHLDRAGIEAAVRPFPVVAGLHIRARPLHTLDVAVSVRLPVAAVAQGDRRMAVAADGTLLPGTLTHGLPVVPIGVPPGGARVTGRTLQLVALLGAAPGPLRARVSSVGLGPHGLVARLTDGPAVYFGPAARLVPKWVAVARVLTDLSSHGATYLDVRVPERPAAGGLEQGAAPPAATPDPQPQVQASQ